MNKENDRVKEEKKARGASREQVVRSLNAIQKHLDFILKVTETSQGMNLMNSITELGPQRKKADSGPSADESNLQPPE